jgi:predicted CoA-binding protein
MTEGWTALLVEDSPRIRRIAAGARRIAVLGMRSERYADRPAHYVARYMHDMGVDVRPVPVVEPDVRTILGKPVYARVADVPPVVDIAVVFRRAEQVSGHVEDLLAARPRCVWLQSGIRDDASAERLARAGILVVQDRCLMVEHRAARAAGLAP